MNVTEKWLLCPSCGSKTRLKLRQDTELKNFLLFCPKCKREVLVAIILMTQGIKNRGMKIGVNHMSFSMITV